MQDTREGRGTQTPRFQHVLLVDDDEYSLRLLQDTLGALGVGSIVCASDGASGLRAFTHMQPRPDLVVCDLYMPDKDGIELIAGLGERGYAGALVLVTAGDMSLLQIARNVAERGHGLQVVGAFAKPVRASDLAHVLGLDTAPDPSWP